MDLDEDFDEKSVSGYWILWILIIVGIVLVVWWLYDNQKNCPSTFRATPKHLIPKNRNYSPSRAARTARADDPTDSFDIYEYQSEPLDTFEIYEYPSTAVPAPKYIPSHIVIIRHANKPDDPTDFTLSETGKTRAMNLVEWNVEQYTDNKPISAIYTALPKPDKSDERPILTSMLFAFSEQIPIYGQFYSEQTKKLRNQIYSNPAVENKAIMIVYEHTCIQQLVSDLTKGVSPGVAQAVVTPKWADDDYASVYIIKFGDASAGSTGTSTVTGGSLSFGCQGFTINGVSDSIICDAPKVYETQVCV
jgi:hypothetical protein